MGRSLREMKLLVVACVAATAAAFQGTCGTLATPRAGCAAPVCRSPAVRARALRRSGAGARGLAAQADPALGAGSGLAGLATAISSPMLHTVAPVLLAVDAGPLEDVQDYITSHPLQDAVAISLMVFTLVRLRSSTEPIQARHASLRSASATLQCSATLIPGARGCLPFRIAAD